jgi:hypothetical protein
MTFIGCRRTLYKSPISPDSLLTGNLLTPNQATGGDTLGDLTGLNNYGGYGTLSLDNTTSYTGQNSFKYVGVNGYTNEGFYVSATTVTPSLHYTAATKIKGTLNATIKLQISERSAADAGLRNQDSIIKTLTGGWDDLSLGATVGSDCYKIRLYIVTNVKEAITMNMDYTSLKQV